MSAVPEAVETWLVDGLAGIQMGKQVLRELTEGIEIERARLGHMPYLMVLWQYREFADANDCELILSESFANVDSGVRRLNSEMAALRLQYSRTGALATESESSWAMFEEQPSGIDFPAIKELADIQVVKEGRIAFGAGESMRTEFCLRLLGQFNDSIVSRELFAALGNSQQQLRNWFLRLGAMARAERRRVATMAKSKRYSNALVFDSLSSK